MTMRLYHISDLHITNGDKLATVDPAGRDELVARLLGVIYTRHFQAPGVHLLVTGDLVDNATEQQYAKVSRLLEPFVGHLSCVPGNHDVARLGNFFDPESLDRWRRYIKPLCTGTPDATSHVPTHTGLLFGGEQCRVIGLNSNMYTTGDFACGELGEDQRNALLDMLNQSAFNQWTTIVMLHHRPFGLDWPIASAMRLKDASRFIEIVDGVADAVLYGHTGGGVELPFGVPTHAFEEVRGTQHLDANQCVSTQSYFELRIEASVCTITQLRCPA